MTLRCRLGVPVEEPPEADEIRVGFLPDFQRADLPRYKVTRGRELVGWLVDRTAYPPPMIAVKHPALGYITPAISGAPEYVWTVEAIGGGQVFGGPWPHRVQALEAMLGEPVEEIASIAPKGGKKR